MEEKNVAKEETIKKEKKFVWTWRSFLLSFLWIAVLVIVVDLASKWGVVNFFRANPNVKENPHISTNSIEVIPHFSISLFPLIKVHPSEWGARSPG